MNKKSVGLRIVRGGAIGAFIGIVAGIGIPTALHWKDIMENKDKITLALGNKVIETFSDGTLYDMDDGVKFVAEIYENMFAGVEINGVEMDPNTDSDTSDADEACGSLEDVILRFHVRANSNSDEDIALKLAVRDAVLIEMGRQMRDSGVEKDMTSTGAIWNYTDNVNGLETQDNISASGRDGVLEFLEKHLDDIEETAEAVIRNYGYNYEVKAYISEDYFPIRQYGELTLPAGTYTALRVDIGKAAGENFWCLLYPTMCYTVDSEAFVSKEGEDRLEQALTEEDYNRLFVKKDLEKGELTVKFKILEWLGL